MGKAKGDARIRRGLVDMTVHPDPDVSPSWVYEPEEHDEEYRCESPVGDGQALIYRQVFRQGRLVDFNISQCVRRGGKWLLVARADSCHGTVHLHLYDQAQDKVGDPELIGAVGSQRDLEDGYEEADDMLQARWSDNLRRWTDGG